MSVSKKNSKSATSRSRAKGNKCLKSDHDFDWWWRRLVFAHYVDPKLEPERHDRHFETLKLPLSSPYALKLSSEYTTWKRNIELIAWRYELQKRLSKDSSLPSFPYLDLELYSWIAGAMREPMQSVARITTGKVDESIWSDPSPPLRFLLTADEEKLKTEFMTWICEQRRKRKLPFDTIVRDSKGRTKIIDMSGNDNFGLGKTKSKNKGVRKRGVSWQCIELMDLSQKEDLNSNQIKIVEKFRREGQKSETKFKDAIENWKKFKNSDDQAGFANEWLIKLLEEHFPSIAKEWENETLNRPIVLTTPKS